MLENICKNVNTKQKFYLELTRYNLLNPWGLVVSTGGSAKPV